MHSFVYGIMSLVWLSSSGGGAELAPPVNLTLITMNTHFNLSWSQGARHRGANVSFSVQYVPSYKLSMPGTQWLTACENTPHTWCDLTPRKLYFQAIYTLRVRTHRGPLRSGWVLKEFCADKEAALGPPSRVDLAPAGALLNMMIWDPRSSTNGSMKELYPRMYYRVVYWEHSDTRSPDTVVVDTRVNTVTLPDLRAWTWYCVSVQSRYDFYSKTSAFTTPHCMQTEGAVPWWQILLIFSLSGLVGFVGLLVLLSSGLYCYRTAKDTLFPAVTLPPHFQAYLMDLSPGSDAPRLLTPDSESELTCDRLSICPQVVPLEVHLPPLSASTAPPSGLEADARHNRQDSGGSGDSGVYSTEGGSGPPRHCSHDLPSLGTEEPWDGGSTALLEPVSLEQVSLEQVSLEHRGLKAEAAGPWGVRDEGIMDMGV
ncbi:interferon alpha/beta receptor 1b [Gadus morhua]|uniref:Interferon alpha/beta receptor 1b-like n=1 Tax=Gadus morhua TaxID=8049 RepID=A0A8C5F780_GADMO|nr:interferon alpha/beta receptor 1b-like [Gadus morhua]